MRGETGPDGQNIFGHTDVLINDIFFFVNANTCTFKTINKDNSYFFRNTQLSFDMGPVPPKEHFKNKHAITRWMIGKMATKTEGIIKTFQKHLCGNY